MIYLFLDTTALHRSWRLDGTSWESIRDAINLNIVTVATSTITVSELERQAMHDAAEVNRGAEQLARDLRRHYIDFEPTAVKFDAVQWRAAFADRLRERGIGVVERADPSHDVLLARDLARLPPFKQSGEGYRDALIWLTFLEWIARLGLNPGDELYFVSDNTTQFLEAGKRNAPLHPYIQQEVRAAAGLEAKHLADIKAVTEKVRPLALTKKQALEAATAAYNDADIETENEAWSPAADDQALHYAQAQTSKLVGASLDDLNLLKEVSLRGHTVDGVPFPPVEEGDITAVDLTGVDEAYQSDVLDGTELWTVDLDASIEVEAPLHKQDVNELPEEGTIVDPDWNRHYMLVSFPVHARLRYDVRTDGEDVTDGQLVDVTLLPSS